MTFISIPSPASLPLAMVGHLVGDYLLQNDWMAAGKKKSSAICAVHCLIWTAAVTVFASWWLWWIPPVLFVTHFAQDRTGLVRWYMRVMRQNQFAQPPLAPWSMIAVDNTMHLVVLAVLSLIIG